MLVQGDTNAAIAGALAANARELPLMHVEAGLRSHDRRMPEEHNRVVVDHLSDVCFAPTDIAATNLANEGIGSERVVITGNTVVEAVMNALPPIAAQAEIQDRYRRRHGPLVVATFHRPENVDDPVMFRTILRQLAAIDAEVILPLHPRGKSRADEWGLSRELEGISVIEPVGYKEFLALAAQSDAIVSDSGGIQEEASVLKKPVIVVRRSTERPEILGTFGELVNPSEVTARTSAVLQDGTTLQRLASVPSPYGDGSSSSLIVDALNDYLHRIDG